MVQRGRDPRFFFKTAQPFLVLRHTGRKNLDRQFPPEPDIPGAVHLTHSPGSQAVQDLVVTQFSVRSQAQGCPSTIYTGVPILAGDRRLRQETLLFEYPGDEGQESPAAQITCKLVLQLRLLATLKRKAGERP